MMTDDEWQSKLCEWDATDVCDLKRLRPGDLEQGVPTQMVVPIAHGPNCPGHLRRLYSPYRGGIETWTWTPVAEYGSDTINVSEEYL